MKLYCLMEGRVMELTEILHGLNKNKEWIFNGIGVFIISLTASLVLGIRRAKKTDSKSNQNIDGSNHNIQIGPNAQIKNLIVGHGVYSNNTSTQNDIAQIREKGILQIDVPNDREFITKMPGECIPIVRLVKGHILDYSRSLIEERDLLVEVIILTDKWYSQGITKVNENGRWEMEVHYGGLHHTVKAVLKNNDSHEIDEHSHIVTLIQ